MEKELQRKIDWLKSRHEQQAKLVEQIETNRQSDRSSTAKQQLKVAKKEKLRLKDMITMMERLK